MRGFRFERGDTVRRVPAVFAAAAVLLAAAVAYAGPFADFVQSFTPGMGAGFGQDQFPGIVLGPPHGGGELQGSLDVLSLGNDGVIVLGFDPPVICDGPGPDLTVFENPFHSGSINGPIFIEYGIVGVSQDGINFIDFPHDNNTHAGLAGQTPVLSNPDNDISPLDPSVSGGDQFDLADVGLTWAKYVRITDPGASIDDPGNHIPPGTQAGFDLDAVAALHACDPFAEQTPTATPTDTPTATPIPSATATPSPPSTATPEASVTATATSMTGATSPPPLTATLSPTASASATATMTAVATVTATVPAGLPGDLDGNGRVDADDLRLLIGDLFGTANQPVEKGIGASRRPVGAPQHERISSLSVRPEEARSAVSKGRSNAAPADVNGDGRITAADLTALLSHWSP